MVPVSAWILGPLVLRTMWPLCGPPYQSLGLLAVASVTVPGSSWRAEPAWSAIWLLSQGSVLCFLPRLYCSSFPSPAALELLSSRLPEPLYLSPGLAEVLACPGLCLRAGHLLPARSWDSQLRTWAPVLAPVGLLATRRDPGKQSGSPVGRQGARQDGPLLQQGQLSSSVTNGCALGWLGAQ